MFFFSRHAECFPILQTSDWFQNCQRHLWIKGEICLIIGRDLFRTINLPNAKPLVWPLSLCRWFFEALAYPRTHQLVVTNGIAMAVVFFLVRIAVMPPYWAKVFGTFGTPAFERLGLSAQVAWIVSCICLDILNTIWMYKIARGCYKVITGKLRGGKVDSKKTDFVNNHTDWESSAIMTYRLDIFASQNIATLESFPLFFGWTCSINRGFVWF